MADEFEKLVPAEGQPAYEAPRALRLGGPGAAGQQACLDPGSANLNLCSTGNGATGDGCDDQGNDAQPGCAAYGNGAAGSCMMGENPQLACDQGSGVLD
jgi:hypothetical protein